MPATIRKSPYDRFSPEKVGTINMLQQQPNANALIGKTVQINSITLIIREKIGEGGFAFVYRAEDSSGNMYAYKLVNALSRDRFEQCKNEGLLLTNLSPHKNIVKLIAFSANPGTNVLQFLFELCPSTAMTMIMKKPLTREEIICFFTAICEATAHLHMQQPSIMHRDLKPENLLVSSDGTVRLCDFGSATTKIVNFSQDVNLDLISSDIERNTTGNYRAPEMLDLYTRRPIGPPSDIWALGCTLFKLIYGNDLFNPEEKLPILQGRCTLPAGIDPEFERIIKMCIKVDPASRPTALNLLQIIHQLNPSGNDRIALQPHHFHVNMPKMSSNPEKEEWAWWRAAQESWTSWTSSGPQKWAIKATFASNAPPKTKYVRRILLAAIKHDVASTQSIIAYLFERPWQKDPRVAAKVLYLTLLLLQYETVIGQVTQVASRATEIAQYYATKRVDTSCKVLASFIDPLAKTIMAKLRLHSECPELEGNLASGSNRQNNQKLREMMPKYSKILAKIGSRVAKTINDDFSVIVLAQPIFEELSYCVSLLRSVSGDCAEVMEAMQILGNVRQIPYLQSSVVFPSEEEHNQPPKQRFISQSA